MAIFERRNDRPAALGPQRSGGWRVDRSCCLARNAAAWRQGKKIANEPLREKVGERSERIVARDPPTKGRYGEDGSNPQEGIGSQAPHHRRDRTPQQQKRCTLPGHSGFDHRRDPTEKARLLVRPTWPARRCRRVGANPRYLVVAVSCPTSLTRTW